MPCSPNTASRNKKETIARLLAWLMIVMARSSFDASSTQSCSLLLRAALYALESLSQLVERGTFVNGTTISDFPRCVQLHGERNVCID